jgi:predicted secreted protein
MKVWNTRKALTQGIKEYETADYDPELDIRVVCVMGNTTCGVYGTPEDWHRTEKDAILRVLKLIARKRKSLTKAMIKMEKLEVEFRDKLKGCQG